MLDAVIHKHLDVMDAIHDQIDAEISDVVSKINIDAVMSDPQATMLDLVEYIKAEVLQKHLQAAVNAGEDFAKAIKKDGDVVVQETNNPKTNA